MSVEGKNTAEVTSRPACFRLKGGLFPLTLLEVNHYDEENFRRELQHKVTEAPAFFQRTPVIISLEDPAHLDEICRLCREFNMLPVGVRENSFDGHSDNDNLRQQAISQGLALMVPGRDNRNRGQGKNGRHFGSSNIQNNSSKVSTGNNSNNLAFDGSPKLKTPVRQSRSPRNDKIVTSHIRSGQQVYAAGGDLVVMAPVSAGAEILADGNIHVYGPLRGRALAGVQGDRSARVFCQSLEAELISIAGHFKLNDDFRSDHWKEPAHIHLDNQTLCITALYPKSPI